jgi:hypothetical protein
VYVPFFAECFYKGFNLLKMPQDMIERFPFVVNSKDGGGSSLYHYAVNREVCSDWCVFSCVALGFVCFSIGSQIARRAARRENSAVLAPNQPQSD